MATQLDYYTRGIGLPPLGEEPGAITLGDQALFASAGGYHHQMAMNAWNSRGAGPRAKTLGMGVVDILVPTEDELDLTRDRLVTSGHQTTFDGQTLSVLDPWHNEIRLAVG